MNFFEQQDRARRQTGLLVLLFVLAVCCLIALTNLLVVGVLAWMNGVPLQDVNAVVSYFSTTNLIKIALIIGLIVLLAALFRLMQLAGGGRVVAESLGGRLLNHNTDDGDERKVLNVVEEMAIASGTPVPPVYLLEENAINAFAAGYKPRDAVIGVTRGCINQLDRDELQGVIAHEFSHIFNGDMRLNLRLMGILYGILVIGNIGHTILRGVSRTGYGGRSKGKGALPFLVLGAGLMIIGYAGTFFGNLIKAAVSRQREFLADASAVQFTRNPDGIAGALKRIGGFHSGSQLIHPQTEEVSHLFFGQAVTPLFNALMSTHPPLEKRIKRIEPRWSGEFLVARESVQNIYRDDIADRLAGITPGVATTLATAEQAIDHMSEPEPQQIDNATNLLATIPERVLKAAHEPYGARALVYLLLLDTKEDVRAHQLQTLENSADTFVLGLLHELRADFSPVAQQRLPLIDMCLPSLQQLAPDQYQQFKANVALLMRADNRVELSEWALYRVLLHNLEPQPLRIGDMGSIGSLKLASKALGLVLSALAGAGVTEEQNAQASFAAASKYLAMPRLRFVSRTSYELKDLSRAVTVLARLKPLLKPKLLKAMCVCVAHDGVIEPVEAELIRAFADCLDCPMPPLANI